MGTIEVRGLKKVFRQAVKDPGLAGAIKHLFTRKFTEKTAVSGIDLTVEEGEAIAYVGPNGAGKSTTIKMLTGILVPTSGEIRVMGVDPFRDRMRNARQIGAVFGQRTQLWWDIPVRESFALLKDIYEIPEDRFRRNLNTFIELLGMDEFLGLTGRKLSLGQRMRADLAAALLHDPKIVYLDEPTIGLDVAVKENIRGFVRALNRELGTTIMLTTHDLKDIEDICRRLVIIDHGRIIYDGTIEAVKDAFATERTIHFQGTFEESRLRELADRLPAAEVTIHEPGHFSVRFNRFVTGAPEITSQVMGVAEVADFRISEPDIEEVIRKVYEGGIELPRLTGMGA
ncbi:ATP-binding cassette domain-containing protein [Cohnella sp. CFH 77786]|uniref:ABC transporter ATP-binding protein n=1 Tax=Cohnella sp. CFH 77786 TaxID=2662265 RepID=UPI001C60A016|nr:ATP-binding cassette domain-containing protein [Cohnella sp. CFH 77786]MBW5449022.1 ATP-binding cassette domain-containing protein [Cohnella sp. CFH 77786]